MNFGSHSLALEWGGGVGLLLLTAVKRLIKPAARNNAGKKNPAATALMANAYANTAVPEKIKNLVAIFRLRENTKTSSRFHHPNRKGNDKIYQST